MDDVLHQPSGFWAVPGSGRHRKPLERVIKVLLPLLSFFLQGQRVPKPLSQEQSSYLARKGPGSTGPFSDPEAITASCHAGVSCFIISCNLWTLSPLRTVSESLFLKSPQLILSVPSVFSAGTLVQISVIALMDKQTSHRTSCTGSDIEVAESTIHLGLWPSHISQLSRISLRVTFKSLSVSILLFWHNNVTQRSRCCWTEE